MSNLAKLEFLALDITRKNYLSWVLDAEIHLNANGIGDTIKEGNKTSVQDKAKTMIFLRHHLYVALKTEYLTMKDPLMLWKNLKDRYDHQKTVILPRARYEWVHLRLQDFKLVTEQNNELLMKNHETRATGTTPFPEANVATFNNQNGGRGRGSDCGCRRGQGRGHGFGRGIYLGVQFKNTSGHNKWQDKGKMNEKGKEVEANFVYDNENVDSPGGHGDHVDPTHLDNMDQLETLTTHDEDVCLVDRATTHTILKMRKYFSQINIQKSNVHTISDSAKLIEGSGKAYILLSGGTQFKIDNALFSAMSQRNLLSFKDIRKNGYHIETASKGKVEYLHVTNMIMGKKYVLEKLPAFSSGLYYTKINVIESKELNISHLRIFGCAVYVPIPPPQRTKMGPQRSESKARLKRGRPVGSKDKNPQKEKGANNQDGILKVKEMPEGSLEETLDMTVLKEPRGYKMPDSSEKNSREQYAIKLNKSLYGLKQSGCMWELPKAKECLKKEFEMKDLGNQSFALDCKLNILMMEF
nr:uncharacterized protein [Tanacetum cinerariifolium]